MKLFGQHHAEEKPQGRHHPLRAIPIFTDLSRRELASVERILHRREYQKDEVVFRQDDPGIGMYIVESGKIAIISDPGAVELSVLSDGDFFGELPLLDSAPRSATAIARTHSRILGFFQPDLFSLIERDPRLGVKLVMHLAAIIGSRLRVADENVRRARLELEQARRTEA